MAFKQQIVDRMERCYCVGSAEIDGENIIYAASEAKGGEFCIYSPENFQKKEVIWEHGGGTMTIVPVPQEQNTLYAIRNFFPGFEAEEASVVCCQKRDGKWEITPVLNLPYLHRFDIFDIEGKRIFLGTTLCTSKKAKDDWSDPGKVYIGFIGNDVAEYLKVEVLAEGLTKNHGYWRGDYKGRPAGYIASENGIFVFVPGRSKEECMWERIWGQPTSEAVFFDLDGCGKKEMITIEPFHGNSLNIYKLENNGEYKRVYTYSNSMEFAHALWAGTFLECPAVVCGARRMNKELFMVTYEKESFHTTVLDKGNGSANVSVFELNGQQYILSANHARGEVAVYSKE